MLKLILVLATTASYALAEMLLLRSQSFNTISQEEITGADLYNISTIIKGGGQLDFSLNMQRINITTFVDTRGDTFKDEAHMYFLRSFFTGEGEQVRLSAVIINSTLFIKDYFLKAQEGVNSSSTLFSVEILTKETREKFQCPSDPSACKITYLIRKYFNGRDGFVFQIEVDNRDGNRGHYMAFISIRYEKGKIVDASPVYFSEIRSLTYPGTNNQCEIQHARVFSINRNEIDGVSQIRLFFIRYCGLESEKTTPSLINEIEPVEWNITESSANNSLKYYTTRKNYTTAGLQELPFSIIKVFFSYPFIIFGNLDKMISVKSETYEQFLKQAEDKSELMEPKFDVLYSVRIRDLFCNFINLNELSCLFMLQRPTPTQAYQIVEFVSLKESIMTIDIPVNLTTLEKPQDAINTKNYLILRFSDEIHICKKREKMPQYPMERGHVRKDNRPCLKVDIPKNYEVKVMRELLLEENYSNCIDGYLLVALSEKLLGVSIRPLLISCPYFSIKIDTKVDSASCDRYLKNCDSTEIVFSNDELEQVSDSKDVQTRVYVVDENFNSILPTTKDRNLTVSNNQKLSVPLSDYYRGDVTSIEVSPTRPFSPVGRWEVVMSMPKTDYFASFPSHFIKKFDGFLRIRSLYTGSYLRTNWALVQINSDMTFLQAVCSTYRFENLTGNVTYVTKTTPNIDLTEADGQMKYFENSVTQHHAYLANTKRSFLLPRKNNQKDSMYYLTADKIKRGDESFIYIELKNYKGSRSPFADEKDKLSIKIEKDENFLYLRTPLDLENDLVGVITTKRIFIVQIMVEEDERFNTLLSINLTMFSPRGEINVTNVKDILISNNIMLLDMILKKNDDVELSRVYIYNIDLNRKYFYSYGFIKLDKTAMVDGYTIYYSKESDKAILVYYATKTVVEFSLDNTFLDINKIGSEIIEDTRKVIDYYGSKMIKKFIPDKDVNDNSCTNRTLKIPFTNHYILILEIANGKEDGNPEYIILLGQISSLVLSTFKSYSIVKEPLDEFIIPQVVADIKINVIPLMYRPRGSLHLHVIFLYMDQTVELNYKRIFARTANENKASLDLNVQFMDINGITNTDTFVIPRDLKFSISSDIYKHGWKATDKRVPLRIKEYGFVSDIALICGTKSKQSRSYISRNLTMHLECPEDRFNATVLPHITKDCAYDPDLKRWKDIIDLVQLDSDVHEGVFAILEKSTLAIFLSNGSVLRPLAHIDSCSDRNREFIPANCKIFRSFKKTQDGWLISLFCQQSNSAPFLKSFSISKESVDRMIAGEYLNLTYLLDKMELFKVNANLWTSIQKDSTSVKFLKTLLFVKTEVTIFSIGSKKVVDIYQENEDVSDPRFVISNSTLQDKYSRFQIEDFAVSTIDMEMNSGKDYKLVELLIDEETYEMRLAHAYVKYQQSGSVAYKMLTHLNVSALEGMANCIPIHGEVHTGRIVVQGDNLNQHYSVYIVCEDYVHEIKLVEANILKSSGTKVMKIARQGNIRKFNYGGLCESRSSYKIEVSDEYLILNCVPLNSLSPNQFIIGYSLVSTDDHEVVNPIFTLLQFLGYTDKNSRQKLFKGADKKTRLIKTSPRSLVEQFTIHEEAILDISVDNRSFNSRLMHLLLGNTYEKADIRIDLSEAFLVSLWTNFKEIMAGTADLVVVCLIYVLCFILLLNIQSFFPSLGNLDEEEMSKKRWATKKKQRVARAGLNSQKLDHDLSTKLLITDVFG